MPHLLTRPTKEALEKIEECLLESDLTPKARLQLRAVMAWARGKTSRQVAADRALRMSDFSVRSAIRKYRTKGLDAFTNPEDRPPGRQQINPDIIKSVASDIQQALTSGIPLPYRDLAKKHKISLGKVAAIAKAEKFNGANRRGAVRPVEAPGTAAVSPALTD